ncbi:peroxisome proliferator-activated receptor gamma coactivator 1-alpha isoform X1 [Cimex lectularius]|uniref:RRM domain-containing protein n=1 Tax=Cimex lectularius TaxID=79782 RepID=A0A8I6RAE4_CIMLE|nr:peroxisome proliferator-activated receptor gamma coactivator 1-alpha isoform X1 [Cimex lectularius]
MEAGFVNQHDEYFSSDIYDQSNGFESENSIFNGLMGDFALEPTKENWNYGESTRCTKDNKEDFQKTFQDWENHITNLQQCKEEDTTLKVIDSGIELLYESVSENLPDIFGPGLKSISANHENQASKPFNLGNVFSQEASLQSDRFGAFQPSDLGPDNYEIVEITIEEDNLINPTPHLDQYTKVDQVQNVETKQFDLATQPVTLETKEKENNKSTDLLPKEVIDRIKAASKRRKCISLIPAIQMDPESKRQRRVKTTAPDETKSEVSIHLDHDYCGGYKKSTCQKINQKDIQSVENWEKNSKKDSGLESGDVSDASETTQEKRIVFKQVKPGESLLRINHFEIKQEDDFTNKNEDCQVPKVEIKNEKQESSFDLNDHESVVVKEENIDIQESIIVKQEPKKKKLNLEEYRSRRKNITTPNTHHIPEIKIENSDCNSMRVMVNVEVQTHTDREENITKDRSRQRQRYRRSSTSSSSSSVASKSRRHRRKSRRRRYSRGSRQRSSWSSSRSRSRSKSSSTSISSLSNRSHSRSSKRYRRSRSRSDYRRSSHNRSRYSSERSYRKHDDWSPVEKQKQIEERRVVYVGQIAEGTTKAQLRERFQKFGPIVDISLHFRERGDNYGFVTFMFKIDAYDAVEHGNDDPFEQRYDICFGGRRAFCKQRYADLDSIPQTYNNPYQNSRSCDSFDTLLREAQETLRKKQKIV